MTIELPSSAPARVSVTKRHLDARHCAELDCIAILLPAQGIPALPAALPDPQRWLERKHAPVSDTTTATTVLDNRRATRVVALRRSTVDSGIAAADAAWRLASACLTTGPESVGILVPDTDPEEASRLAQFLLEAFLINDFRLPNFATAGTSKSTVR
ncbi:MAG: hypothetical protein AAFZ58_10685, partial [Pseudomonadota bacterium]